MLTRSEPTLYRGYRFHIQKKICTHRPPSSDVLSSCVEQALRPYRRVNTILHDIACMLASRTTTCDSSLTRFARNALYEPHVIPIILDFLMPNVTEDVAIIITTPASFGFNMRIFPYDKRTGEISETFRVDERTNICDFLLH